MLLKYDIYLYSCVHYKLRLVLFHILYMHVLHDERKRKRKRKIMWSPSKYLSFYIKQSCPSLSLWFEYIHIWLPCEWRKMHPKRQELESKTRTTSFVPHFPSLSLTLDISIDRYYDIMLFYVYMLYAFYFV